MEWNWLLLESSYALTFISDLDGNVLMCALIECFRSWKYGLSGEEEKEQRL